MSDEERLSKSFKTGASKLAKRFSLILITFLLYLVLFFVKESLC